MKNKLSISKKVIPVVFSITAGFFISSCESNPQYVNEEKIELTKGLITEVKEVEANKFKITDERVVENKEDSRVIAEYLDGTKDTLTLDEVSMTKTEGGDPRRSGMSSVVRMGLMGYFFGRNFGVGPSAGAYANQSAYNKSTSGARTTLSNTANRTTIRKPVRSSSTRSTRTGRSTRSFGG